MYEIEKKNLEKRYVELQKLQAQTNQEREKIYNQLEQIEKLGDQRYELKWLKIETAVQIALDAVVISLMFYMLPTIMRVTPAVGTIMRNAYIAGYGALTALGIKDVVIANTKYKKLATPEMLVLEKNPEKLEKESEILLNRKIDLELEQEQVSDNLHMIEIQEEVGLKEPGTLNIEMPEINSEMLVESTSEQTYPENSEEKIEKKLSLTYTKN